VGGFLVLRELRKTMLPRRGRPRGALNKKLARTDNKKVLNTTRKRLDEAAMTKAVLEEQIRMYPPPKLGDK
jgi:hypothetical protein